MKLHPVVQDIRAAQAEQPKRILAWPLPDSSAIVRTAESFGDYTARNYYDPVLGRTQLEISKNDRIVYTQRAGTDGFGQFYIGKLYPDDPDAKLIKMGIDITGDGQPALVVSEWTEGCTVVLA